ncbi:MAG TPA: transcription elongation factor GreA [Candidatus Limnocylindrales bacterium]|nr:transcription elongation factor GreA [Candidatus Limnocylindrales bacterium]
MTASAADLLRSVGLLADGPVVWGRPVPARTGGVYVLELVAPLRAAPLELTRIGKWLERVPDLRLDGERPSSRALAARLGAFWIPSARVVYVGSTEGSIGGRIEAIRNTVLGERRPHPGGHWLHALSGLETARVWWAPTDAIEEYEDALLSAFAESVPADERAALPDRDVVLPWANLRTATGERKATGLANSLQPGDPVRKLPPTRVVELPPGAADGASGLPPSRAAGGTVRRAPRPATPKAAPTPTAARADPARDEPTWISADGLARLQAEHADLTKTRRPEVIARIKAAKELGDLRENSDYTAAREEQSFLEGRIAQIEATLRVARVIEATADTAGRVSLGATVTIEDDAGARSTFRLVGSAEADPANGRISNVSPVGRAILGRAAGETVEIAAPRGTVRYRIVEVG